MAWFVRRPLLSFKRGFFHFQCDVFVRVSQSSGHVDDALLPVHVVFSPRLHRKLSDVELQVQHMEPNADGGGELELLGRVVPGPSGKTFKGATLRRASKQRNIPIYTNYRVLLVVSSPWLVDDFLALDLT